MKTIYTALLVVSFAAIFMVGSASAQPVLTYGDSEMMLSEYGKIWGPATVTKTDVTGEAVQFDFTGLTVSGTGVGDDFAVHQNAGGALKTYGVTEQFTTHGDFSAYSEYILCFENVGSKDVTVNLDMNTGWTIRPPEYATTARDTFWQNTWTTIAPGEKKMLTLDFSSAEVYGATDDPNPSWQYSDGTTGVQVHRLDEVSKIGFQVCGDGDGSIIVYKYGTPECIPEFSTIAIPAVAMLGLLFFFNRRKHMKE